MNAPTKEPQPFSRKRADLPLQKFHLRHQLKQWNKGIPVIVLCILLVTGIIWYRLLIIKDVEGSTEQTGIAVIEDKSGMYRKHGTMLNLVFRMGNYTISQNVRNEEKWTKTKIGDKVTVTYRVGKSGNIWIGDWEPVTQQSSVQPSSVPRWQISK